MGLLDKLRKKQTNPTPTDNTISTEENAQDNAPEEEFGTPGWDSITECFERLYPGQTSPKHYGTLICWSLGGDDPLDGISIYDGGPYWHFVTYGLSELYEKESEGKNISGYGMEFTLKLKKDNYEDEEAEIRGICGILQTIAKITFTQGEIFQPFEYLYTGQTQGIDTPNGHVDFVEFIGVTDAELRKIIDKEITVKELYDHLATDITDYNRASLY